MTRRPSRRSVLRAAAVLPLAGAVGCTEGPPEPPPPPDPDIALRLLATEREQRLLEAYDVALAAAPELAARLAPLRADHAEHARQLAPPSPSAPVSPSPSPSPSPSAAVAPAEPGAVLDGLRSAERTAAQEHAAGAVGASRELAGLLASLSACEASHQVALA